jgi:hypothetical protein
MTASLVDRVVRREPLAGGASGSVLERGWLEDGSVVVLKRSDAVHDWIMEVTGDKDRIADMWDAGVFEQVEEVADHAILDVERTPTGTVVLMEDVSASLFASGDAMRPAHHRILDTLAALHTRFAGRTLPPLCKLADLYAFLSPQVCERYASVHEVPRLALEGWSRFHDIVPDDVGSCVAAVHADPALLAAPLSACASTLVHGDPKLANLGMNGSGRVVLIDWGTLTALGPPAIDYAWYAAINGAAVAVGNDQLLDDIRSSLAPVDEDALRLSLFGALVQLGWEKALGATHDDPFVRGRERAGLDWWLDRARDAIDLWR